MPSDARGHHPASRIPYRPTSEALGLAVALAFVFSTGLIPHLDTFKDDHG